MTSLQPEQGPLALRKALGFPPSADLSLESRPALQGLGGVSWTEPVGDALLSDAGWLLSVVLSPTGAAENEGDNCLLDRTQWYLLLGGSTLHLLPTLDRLVHELVLWRVCFPARTRLADGVIGER
jgi:hypothetical protein